MTLRLAGSCGGRCRRACCAPRGADLSFATARPAGRRVSRTLALSGGDVGRWGPVTAYGGRTQGEPCPTGIGGMCGDLDVSAWHWEAKRWLEKALWLREMTVLAYQSEEPSTWPQISQSAELGLDAAKVSLQGKLGWTDAAKVETLIKIQNALKLVCEAFAVGVDASGFKIPKEAADPNVDAPPPVIPWPNPFDLLPDLGSLLPMLGLAVAGLFLLTRSGK